MKTPKVDITNIITYDIVSSPSFGCATITSTMNFTPRRYIRKSKINKIFKIKNPLS